MKSLVVMLVGATLVVVAPSSPPAFPAAGGGQLLPNLQTLPPSDLVVRVEGGRTGLFLTNELANVQTGPVEVFPRREDCDGDGDDQNDRTGYQRIFRDTDGDGIFTRGVDTGWTKSRAGCFKFHPAHSHWHFEDYARYDLLRLADGRRVRSNVKVSFCIIDSNHRYPEVPGSPDRRFYESCGPGDTQGVSVGWADIYSSGVPGQYIDITNLPDGDYCVKATTDPNNRLVETDETDNSGSVAITLQGLEITILPQTC